MLVVPVTLTSSVCAAWHPRSQRRSAHDPGVVAQSLAVGVHPALAQSGTLSQFHPLELTAAALTVPSAGIRCPDPGTTVSLAQDADLPAGHRVAHWGGGSGPARVGWGVYRAWRAQGLLERARRATAAAELAVDRLGRWEGLGGGWAGLGRW